MAADSSRRRRDGVPIALTIAGSDSGGGAGIQADLKTFSALGVYGASVITAVTAQNTRAVSAVHPIPPEVVTAQIAAILDDLAVAAVKIGMLGSPEIVAAVAAALKGCEVPLVLDPVMIAKSGDALLSAPAVNALRRDLLPLAAVLTPNLPEAACLLDTPEAGCEAEMERQGERLLALGPQAVVMKGGHAQGPLCVDLLLRRDAAPLRLSAPRRNTRNTHGTGCTLSAAIAAGLAKGQDTAEALRSAHAYLQAAIAAADGLDVGRGHGPVHHFHDLWG